MPGVDEQPRLVPWSGHAIARSPIAPPPGECAPRGRGLAHAEAPAGGPACLRRGGAGRDDRPPRGAGDEAGRPVARLECSGEDAGCAWCHYVVDLSAIGMRRDSPLVVRSREGDNFLSWHLGATPLAHVPKDRSPRETAEVLDRETLLDGFRRSAKAGRIRILIRGPVAGGVAPDAGDGTMARAGRRRGKPGPLGRIERAFFPDWITARDRRRKLVMFVFLGVACASLVVVLVRQFG